jgi:Tol biopolymer transport system component
MRAARVLPLVSFLGSVLVLAACGDDTSGTGGAGGGSGGAASSGASTSDATSGSPASTSASTATSTATASSGSGEGGTGGGAGGGEDFVPSADSIQFLAVSALPAGEQILFNDWNVSPNTVGSMTPDGEDAVTIFEAYRVWSMGVSNDGSTIAFASGDPEQAEHYGIELGDAIQHTFLYDVATEEATALLWGNVNDECHTFSADDATLYVCRRSDTFFDGEYWVSEGYDVARVDVATGEVELILEDDDDVMTLSPQPDADEATMLVQWIALPSTRSIRTIDLASGDVETIVDAAGFPVLSPDGTRFLFNDYTEQGSLWAADLDGANATLVADAQASGARWSPDGTRIVYMVGDDAEPCSHVDVVPADGTGANAPLRIRDCVETGEFITELAWITR